MTNLPKGLIVTCPFQLACGADQLRTSSSAANVVRKALQFNSLDITLQAEPASY
jgi:hypothetical protein